MRYGQEEVEQMKIIENRMNERKKNFYSKKKNKFQLK